MHIMWIQYWVVVLPNTGSPIEVHCITLLCKIIVCSYKSVSTSTQNFDFNHLCVAEHN